MPKVSLETEEKPNGGEWLESLLNAWLEQKPAKVMRKGRGSQRELSTMALRRSWERGKVSVYSRSIYWSWLKNSLFLALASIPWKQEHIPKYPIALETAWQVSNTISLVGSAEVTLSSQEKKNMASITFSLNMARICFIGRGVSVHSSL